MNYQDKIYDSHFINGSACRPIFWKSYGAFFFWNKVTLKSYGPFNKCFLHEKALLRVFRKQLKVLLICRYAKLSRNTKCSSAPRRILHRISFA